MRYKHILTINRGAGGGGDSGHFDENDVFVPDPTPEDNPPVYSGRVDFQDIGTALARDTSGTPTELSDAVAFLAEDSEEGPITLIQPNDRATITFEDGRTMDFTVLRARFLDASVHLRRE